MSANVEYASFKARLAQTIEEFEELQSSGSPRAVSEGAKKYLDEMERLEGAYQQVNVNELTQEEQGVLETLVNRALALRGLAYAKFFAG